MAPGIDPIQFPSQIWQAVSDQARRSLLRLDFCPDQSRIENLRSVHLCEETEDNYGKQVWFFEAIGIDGKNARHILYGALELSVQYGILVTDQTALFDDIEERQKFLRKESQDSKNGPWAHDSTRFWVNTAILCVVVVSMLWVLTLVSYLVR